LEEAGARAGEQDAIQGQVGRDAPYGGQDCLRDTHGIAEGSAIRGQEEERTGRMSGKTPGFR
jgi:hypothetical protein